MILHYVSSKPFKITLPTGGGPQSFISQQRPIESDGSRLDNKWHLTMVTPTRGNDTIEIETLEKQREDKPVYVYESNAGNIFLWKQGDPSVYQDDPFLAGNTIHKGAQAIYESNTDNWRPEWVLPVSQLQRIIQQCHTLAAWYPAGYIEYYEPTGLAGKRFLGLDDPDDKDR